MSDVIHVFPRGDLFEHNTTGDMACLCGPRFQIHCPICGGDDPECVMECVDGWIDAEIAADIASIRPLLVIHHSMDGREAVEQAAAGQCQPPKDER